MKKFSVLFYKRSPEEVLGKQVQTVLSATSADSLREEIVRMYPEYKISIISIVSTRGR